MTPVRIDSPDDPRVAAYRDIRERDLVGRQGLFVAEGKVVLNILFSVGRFEAQSVLVLENRLAGIAETLALAPPSMPVYVASAAVMDGIAGFPIHRGVLAIGRKRTPEAAGDLLSKLGRRALVLVLVGISNHDNAGAIFRNAAGLGADAIFLDPTSCDPLYRKAIRVSVGAVLKTPFAVFDEMDGFVAQLSAAGFELIALSPGNGQDIREATRPDRLALFLGTEGEGLPPELMARMRTVRIPMAGGFDSLNVAAASAIALHAFR
jgi:tRNA G18 (ribose-2'-O)-methylase SpoU